MDGWMDVYKYAAVWSCAGGWNLCREPVIDSCVTRAAAHAATATTACCLNALLTLYYTALLTHYEGFIRHY